MKNIPNIFTLLNLVFGCVAIVYILQNGIVIVSSPDGQEMISVPEKLWLASLFMALAGVVDFLDGFVARLFKATSELGKQLDSLADVVSFGVAPGMILYQFLRLSFAQNSDGLDTVMLWPCLAFIFPAAAAFRLGKFNLDASQTYSFKGLPTPAAGLLIASFPLIYWNTEIVWVRELFLNKWFLFGVIAVVSGLMVSSLPIMSLKFRDFRLQSNLPKILILVIAVVAAILLKWIAVPVVFVAYVLVSLLFKNKIA